jgi:hypothetical protein
MNRALQMRGLSFREVVNEARFEMASQLLRDTRVSVGSFTQILGYEVFHKHGGTVAFEVEGARARKKELLAEPFLREMATPNDYQPLAGSDHPPHPATKRLTEADVGQSVTIQIIVRRNPRLFPEGPRWIATAALAEGVRGGSRRDAG